jgi:succinate dehydrogenase hydrophobic anchor subunit
LIKPTDLSKRINTLRWILKVSSGILLFPLVALHLLSNHLYSGIVISDSLYLAIVLVLSVHVLTALRDLLIEVGMGRAKLYSFLTLVALLLVLPPLFAANSLQNISTDEVKNTPCIDPERIVYGHKSLLLRWREEVVREGNRTEDGYEKSFNTCFSCHSYEKFCKECHSQTGVQPKCFDCHLTR